MAKKTTKKRKTTRSTKKSTKTTKNQDKMTCRSFCNMIFSGSSPMCTGKTMKTTGMSGMFMHPTNYKKGHFLGALLFGIILAIILNQQGILINGTVWWLQALLVFAFAWMMG